MCYRSTLFNLSNSVDVGCMKLVTKHRKPSRINLLDKTLLPWNNQFVIKKIYILVVSLKISFDSEWQTCSWKKSRLERCIMTLTVVLELEIQQDTCRKLSVHANKLRQNYNESLLVIKLQIRESNTHRGPTWTTSTVDLPYKSPKSLDRIEKITSSARTISENAYWMSCRSQAKLYDGVSCTGHGGEAPHTVKLGTT